ncbi:iron reductase [Priestia megaterium]|nr:iron reductase [Priestia megaterium]
MLTIKEQTLLTEKFRVTFKQNAAHQIDASDCIDAQKMVHHLTFIQQQIEAPNLQVAASIFSKRYSFVVLSALYMFSVQDKKLNLSLQNVSLYTTNLDDSLWLPSIHYNNYEFDHVTGSNREKLREKLITELFAYHLEPIWLAIRHITKISKLTLWENIVVYIFWMYEMLLQDTSIERNHPAIKADLHYLLHEAKGSQFGSYHHNPLQRYHTPKQHVKHVQEPVRLRQTCCLSYQTAAKHQYCKTCPVLCKTGQKGGNACG